MIAAAVLAILGGCASTTDWGAANAQRKQLLLIDAQTVEDRALTDYLKQNDQATLERTLVIGGTSFDRMMRILQRLINESGAYRADAPHWDWKMVLISRPEINLTCAPGGRITIFTGMIDRLGLSDAEIAAVLAHELAHALREHRRENISGRIAANAVVSAAVTSRRASVRVHQPLFNDDAPVVNSPLQEREADMMGLDLLARAGFDPQAALGFWRKLGQAGDNPHVTNFYQMHAHLDAAEHMAMLTEAIPGVAPLYEAAAGGSGAIDSAH